jgi:GNAT superfamily N-acetyltransferase
MSAPISYRPVVDSDLEQAIALEQRCYTPEAAASEAAFRFRSRHYRNFFWTAWNGKRLVGITNGIRTHQTSCGDEMKGAQADDAAGRNFCVLTIAVAEEERTKGIGRQLLRKLLEQCAAEGIHTVILMCEQHLIGFYESEGFTHHGLSASEHGGIAWHEMSRRLHTMEHLK